QHALMVSDFMVALEIACRGRNDIRLISSQEIFNNGSASRRDNSRWNISLGGVEFGVIPDKVFGLESKNTSGTRDFTLFFLEADRATMPVTRSSLDKSSFYRKLLAYEATWRGNIHRTHIGWNRFRVLTVTTQSERLQHLLKVCRKL